MNDNPAAVMAFWLVSEITPTAAPWTVPAAVVEQIAEHHRDITINGGVGDRDPQLHRPHDRVGNNSGRRQ